MNTNFLAKFSSVHTLRAFTAVAFVALLGLVAGCTSSPNRNSEPRPVDPRVEATPPPTAPTQPAIPQASAGFKVVPFDQAFTALLPKTVPIYVTIPTSYVYTPLRASSWIWSPPAAQSELNRGVRPENFLILQGVKSTAITYNPTTAQFTCGPDCDEAKAIKSLEDENTKVVAAQRYNLNGAPVLFVEFQNLKPRANQRKRGFAAYVSAGSDNFVALISVRSSIKDERAGEVYWDELKRVMISSSR